MNSGLCIEETPSFRKFRLISNTRSKPPTTRRFRYSSGAMRRKRSTSSALWWVTKGRAAAPPAMGCIIGVSTSTYPRSSRKRRMADTIALRRTKVRRTSGLATRSR